MSSSRPRIPVKLQSWEELNRRVATLSDYLLEKVPTQGILSNLVNPAYTATAGSPSAPLTGYTIELNSAYADVDLSTGIITVNEAGLYEVSGFAVFTGGVNQDSFALEIQQTVQGTPSYNTIAVTEWASKTVAASLSGTVITLLDKGDVIAMGIYESTINAVMLNIQSGQLSITQVT